jgi:nucleoside-diphosphate-sugar epimerase
MLENTIAAARSSGALIVLPGTVYNYGPLELPEPSESAPQRPVTRKGGLRVRMEAALERHASEGGRVLIVRAGDFFGPRAGNNWFSQGLVRVGEPVRIVYAPGAPGVGHQWCYLPDFAKTIAELLNRRQALEAFARFHFGGHWDQDGTMMTESIRRVVSEASGKVPKIRAFPWPLIALASPFVETFREMREMRYLWKRPLKLQNDKLVAFLGVEPHTPWDQAVRESLKGIGSI